MINNRQQSGRRRGRGGQRPQGSQGRPEQGNRIDNRARGNASQLLEKYKTLARDAQMQGDRVMTEYYLQFADHYFRVLSESRARFEENNPNAPRRTYQDDEFDGDEMRAETGADGDEAEQAEDERRERMSRERDNRDRDNRDRDNRDRAPRNDRDQRRPRAEQPLQTAQAEEEGVSAEPREDRPQRGLRPRRNGAENGHFRGEAEADAGIEADRLPPSLAPRAEEPVDIAEPEPAPKRRGRPRKVVEAPAEG